MAARKARQPELAVGDPALRSITALVTLRVGPPGPDGRCISPGATVELPAEEAAGLVARSLAEWPAEEAAGPDGRSISPGATVELPAEGEGG